MAAYRQDHDDVRTTASAHNLIPQPRRPLAESVRWLPTPARPTQAPKRPDLADIWPRLTEVAVWTSAGGSWQEHACFLLSTTDGQWHLISFSDPLANELVPRLRTLPGFDTDLLRHLIGGDQEQMLSIWKIPPPG